jgi:hypothetical protein
MSNKAALRRAKTGARGLIGLLRSLTHRHTLYQVFSDFVALSAYALSNAIDVRSFAEREAAYLQIVRTYERAEVDIFPQALGELVMEFEPVAGGIRFADVLGRLFMDLELSNDASGQFFTPYSLAQALALMTLGDKASLEGAIQERGFVRTSDPAVGGGALVIALAEAMYREGINYQQHLHVTAVDVDARAVHMAYVQLSLLHVPAVIVHGNTLSLQEWGRWYTPAHILGGWNAKLARVEASTAAPIARIERPQPVPVSPAAPHAVDVPQLALF